MKVLKVTYEIPLAERSAVASLQEAGKLVAQFSKDLEDAGIKGVVREESVVTRPGRG